MKDPKPIATYDKENSCIEDVIAIANELAREKRPARDLGSTKSEVSQKKPKRQTGFH